MIFLYKPKYDYLLTASNKVEADNIMNEEGGYFIRFNHEPTKEEKIKSRENYFNQVI
jgi:hypothetical protein